MNGTASQFHKIYTNMIKPTAVRSLQCADHAKHISSPTVLDINWNVGRRCNYDCSYCSPHIHDNISPFLALDIAEQFVDSVDRYCTQTNRTMKWCFTGGEPFIDPGFLTLVEHINSKKTSGQMQVTTNGSLPIKIYQRASDLFDGITFSLHLERAQAEINDTMQKIAQIKNCFVNVNLMLMPGKLEQARHIAQKLQQQGTSFVVRKITPDAKNNSWLPYIALGSGHKEKKLLSLDQQRHNKQLWKHSIGIQRSTALIDFYSQEELDFLQKTNQEITWINCGVWYDDDTYREMNSDMLLTDDAVQFYGWTCYAGVDHLYVDHDGQIYRGICLNNGPLGHISNWKSMLVEPTVCRQPHCVCAPDICVRKFAPAASMTIVEKITGNVNNIVSG